MESKPDNLFTSDVKPFFETKRSQNIGTFLLFLVWPILSIIFAFKNYKHYSSRNVIWLYNIFLGLTFYFQGDFDAQRYSDELLTYHSKADLGLVDFFVYIFTDSQFGRIDFVQPFITYLVSRFTDNSFILLGFFGFFYGYFYSRNIWFLIDRMKGKIKSEALAYFLLLCFLSPIWNIVGFRFWAAILVFIHGIVIYFYEKKINKGLFFIVFSVFIHDTFIIAILIFISYLLVRRKTSIIFYFYLTTLIIGGVGKTYIGEVFDRSSLPLKDRSGYLNEDYIETKAIQQENLNWYIKYQFTGMKILLAGSFIWIFFFRRKILESLDYNLDFFSLGLLFLGFVNLTQDIPSMERFYYVGFILVTMMLFLFFQNTNFSRRPDWYKVLSLTIISIYVLVQIWSGSIYFTMATLLGNPFTMVFFDNTVNINTIIKSIIN